MSTEYQRVMQAVADQVEELFAHPVKFLRECHEMSQAWHVALLRIAKLIITERGLRSTLEAERRALDMVEQEVVQLKLQIIELKRALEVFAVREVREGRA